MRYILEHRKQGETGLPPPRASQGESQMPTTGTVQLHRVFRAPPERVYRAFLEADAMAMWIPPYGFTCTVHHMDARLLYAALRLLQFLNATDHE